MFLQNCALGKSRLPSSYWLVLMIKTMLDL
jgi:hypothetical protein